MVEKKPEVEAKLGKSFKTKCLSLSLGRTQAQMLKLMSGKDLLFGNGELSLIAARFTAWVESALLGGWGTVLSLKFRMTFVVAFHTADQEAPRNNDRATQSMSLGLYFHRSPQQAVSQASRLDAV